VRKGRQEGKEELVFNHRGRQLVVLGPKRENSWGGGVHRTNTEEKGRGAMKGGR